MALKVLVTGAAGFAGSHIVEALTRGRICCVAMDSLTYAARLGNLSKSKPRFICHDFRQPITPKIADQIGPVDYIIHNGAESHVARSFQEPQKFVESNIFGTLNLLEFARTQNLKKFIYVSTDEVFGPAAGAAFREDDPLQPTNPYAATKAAGEQLVNAYYRSFGLPAIITRTMNMFGERQHYEKFVPKVIGKVLAGEHVIIHTGPNGEVSTRHWLHASEQAYALSFLLRAGEPGESYNVSSGTVKSNVEIAQSIADILEKPLYYFKKRPTEPAHDMHYSLDDSKMKTLWDNRGLSKVWNFDSRLRQTVLWYREHPEYLEEQV